MEISHSSSPWYRSDATALAGYANMMMMMMMMMMCSGLLKLLRSKTFSTAVKDKNDE